MRIAIGIALLAAAACSSGPPSASEGLLALTAARQADESGLQVWAFELTNRTEETIQLLDVLAGYGGKLESLGGMREIAHACEQGKSTVGPRETIRFVRRESRREDGLGFKAVYRRSATDERLEASVTVKLD
jgi:hypothetical protein